jgi:hypothetical protein
MVISFLSIVPWFQVLFSEMNHQVEVTGIGIFPNLKPQLFPQHEHVSAFRQDNTVNGFIPLLLSNGQASFPKARPE